MSHVAIYVQKHLTPSNQNKQRLTLARTRYNAYCCICMYVLYAMIFFVLWSILLVLIIISVFSASIKSRMMEKTLSLAQYTHSALHWVLWS